MHRSVLLFLDMLFTATLDLAWEKIWLIYLSGCLVFGDSHTSCFGIVCRFHERLLTGTGAQIASD